MIEKCNEFNLPLCVGYIDYEKAFDSVEHFAIFEALRKINVKEDYVQILENIYFNATGGMESSHSPLKGSQTRGSNLSKAVYSGNRRYIQESRTDGWYRYRW